MTPYGFAQRVYNHRIFSFRGNANVKVTRQLTGLDSQTLNPVIRLVIVFVLFTLYILAFKILYPLYGSLIGAPSFSTFITLPVLAAAYLFGIKAGLAAWFVSVPLQFCVIAWCGEAPLPVMTQGGGFVGLGWLLIAIIPIGYLHDLRLNVKRESAARQK